MPKMGYRQTKEHREKLRETRKLPYGEASFNELYSRYRGWARERNIIFKLTKKQFKKIVQNDCNYCGTPPSRTTRKDLSRYNGKFIYSGVDRINSNGSYTVNNCVACCKICNYGKHAASFEDFKNWIEKVYKNLFEKK